MADGKWIPGLTVETPVVDGARKVLSLRLGLIRHFLPLAAQKPDEDIEYVHQLRVATRRARSALDIFASCLPDKTWKAARKQLRHIRRAAGEARDWDVFQEMLRSWSVKRPVAEYPGLDFLRGYAFETRVAAQANLLSASENDLNAVEIVSSLGEPSHRRHPLRLAEIAVPILEEQFVEFEKAMTVESSEYEYLHRIRILGKRIRYAMEVFADLFSPPFRQQVYPAIEELQEILGAANDGRTAAERLGELRDRLKNALRPDWARLRPGIERLLQAQRRRLPEERKKFRAWRTRWAKVRTALAPLLLVSQRSASE
jgi:CHAD domain-containing protein